jgi:hypothetical protein
MSSAFVRALSPAIQSLTSAVIQSSARPNFDREDVDRVARHRSLMGAASPNEIIELIPSDYRIVLADPLHALVQHVIKLHNAQSTLAKWKAHQVANTFPPFIRASPPAVQYSKAFTDSELSRPSKDALDLAFSEYQSNVLKAAVAGKSHEEEMLRKEIEPEHLLSELRKVVTAHAPSVLERYKLPIESFDDDGNAVINGWAPSDAAIATRDFVLIDCVVYASRVVSMTEYAQKHKKLKFEKKRDLATAARTTAGDVDMADATSFTAESVKSLVDKAVAAALKAQMPKTPPKPQARVLVRRSAKERPHR